jgi:hypothetical protein
MNQFSQTVDRRKDPRQRTFKSAKIIHNKRCSVLDCRVINLSSTGARLDIVSVKELPPAFEMRVNPEPNYYPARLVWQKANVVGIEWAK